ncbi:MAG: carboxypeptidase-like regulatory domain-containing protein [Acidimicrobiia bacterium]|nr:carboxypeptidase-like regulatory domain-containing protein [Acidimicrobiia bacterium]
MTAYIVRGVVVDQTGQAVDEAAVSFVDGPGSWPDIAAMTGDDGRFALTAPIAGQYRLGVRADGYDLVEVAVAVGPETGDGATVTVTLPATDTDR